MATSYSSNLALALPVTGELSGTWGTTVNSSITNMLDEALGYQAYSATGGADTLTIPDGVTGVARSIYIQLNGTGGGSVAVPTTKTKMYFVFNNTSSAITFKVTGQTGVSIPAAAKMALVSNGTDIIVAQNYFSALTLGAALPVASGGTGLTSGTSGGVLAYTASGTLASSSALAASALVIGGGAGAAPSTTTTGTGVVTALGVNTGTAGAFVVNGGALGTPSSGTLTNATGLPISTGVSGLGSNVATFLATPSSANLAAAVTDETGSGALVFATSPTLVTPALGTPSSGTVTNLTGTASININGTVGATSATTGAFTTLTTSSTVTHNGGTANGVAYLNGSKVLTTGSVFTFDGSTVANINSSGTGFSTQDAASNFSILRLGTDSANGYAFFQSGKSGTGTTLPFAWRQDSSERMRLDSTGLGIGTSSPSAKLHVESAYVNASTTATGIGIINSTSSQATGYGGSLSLGGVYTGSSKTQFGYILGAKENASDGNYAGYLSFATRPNGADSVERMRLDSAGNLYLGALSLALANENILTGGQGGGIQLIRNVSSAPTSGQSLGTYAWKGSDSANTNAAAEAMIEAVAAENFSGVTAGTNMLFYTKPSGTGPGSAPTERLRIDSSGNLLVGTTSSSAIANKNVDVNGTGDAAFVVRVGGTTTSYLYSTASTTILGTASAIPLVFYTNNTERARIDGNSMTLSAIRILISGASGIPAPVNDGDGNVGTSATGGLNLIGKGSSTDILFLNKNGGTAGSVATGATTITTSSDERLKENFQPITGALDIVCQMRHETGNYKSDPSRTVAFLIAQDVDKLFPYAVEKADPDSWGVNYNWITPLHGAAITELTALVKEQQALITQLKARLDAANL